jgi:hypothetical protein
MYPQHNNKLKEKQRNKKNEALNLNPSTATKKKK